MNIIESIDELLIEMRVHGNPRDSELIIAHKGNIWAFDLDSRIEQKMGKTLKRELNLKTVPMNFSQLAQQTEDRIDILNGFVRDNKLIIVNGIKYDPKSSVLVRKVVKELGLDSALYNDHWGGTYETGKDEMTRNRNIPDTMYHGTVSEYLMSILKKGIRSTSGETNFENIDHDDVVFLTTRPEKALAHSYHTAKRVNSIPIIIEAQIKDKAKLVPDFDIDLIVGDDDMYDGVDDSYKDSTGLRGTTQGDPMKISQEVGVYGFLGKVLPQNFSGIYIPHKRSALSDITVTDFESDFVKLNREEAIDYYEAVEGNQ